MFTYYVNEVELRVSARDESERVGFSLATRE